MRLTRWLSWPALSWFLFFIFAPILLILTISFSERGVYGQILWNLNVSSYANLISPVVVEILLKTILMAGGTAVACVSLGILAAWAMAAAPSGRRDFYLALIVVPFLTNGLIRILGIKSFVSVDGPLDWLLTVAHVPHDAFYFSTNNYLVAAGMITCYLPFAVLPLFGAFEKFDFTLIEAAQDLGADQTTVLFRVVLPVLWKPLMGALFLVFIPCLGEYLIPDLLGGAKTMLLGNLITEKFLKARDWPTGSALAIGLIGCLLVAWFVIQTMERKVKR